MGLVEGWIAEMNSRGTLSKKKAMKKIVEKWNMSPCTKY